jgi:flagellar motor switch protein FliN
MSGSLSQEEIDALLKGNDTPSNRGAITLLTPIEIDTIGEIGNISMGSAATTLSMLLGNKVDITTPVVTEYLSPESAIKPQGECVTIQVNYKSGLRGAAIFVINIKDTAIIADLMMGGDGNIQETELSDLQLSAAGEAMNQMIGTSCTTMSSMYNIPIDITPPIVELAKNGITVDLAKEVFEFPIIAVSFKLKVGDLIDSEIVQLVSLDSVKEQINRLMKSMNTMIEGVQVNKEKQSVAEFSQKETPAVAEAPITVQPAKFTSFDNSPGISGEKNKNLDLLMDVKLKLTVELGRSELTIKKVLELTRGSVIELDKVAGEPVELYANGKLIARGEVIVIEDNFGLRITNISNLDGKFKNL